MKKFAVLVLVLAVLAPVFGQEEYTIHYSDNGKVMGAVTIQRDKGGKITITPKFIGLGHREYAVSIDHALCPLLPDGKEFRVYGIIIIDGAITTETRSDGGWEKTVVDGATTMVTDSNGSWWKTVVDGNTETFAYSDGSWRKWVVDGATTTGTESSGWWWKAVVDGNTTTTTYSNSQWNKTIVDGNTTTETDSDGSWKKTVIDGTTTTETDSGGNWSKRIVDGNTTTVTWVDGDCFGWTKTIVDKQGYTIYITETSGQ